KRGLITMDSGIRGRRSYTVHCTENPNSEAQGECTENPNSHRTENPNTTVRKIRTRIKKSSSKKQGKENSAPAKANLPVRGSRTPKPIPEKRSEDGPHATRAKLPNPEMEFSQRMIERHGPALDSVALLRDIRQELGDTGLEAFLAADTKITTNPGGLRN